MASAGDLLRRQVHGCVAEHDERFIVRCGNPTGQGADSGKELVDGERFCHVVISARIEGFDHSSALRLNVPYARSGIAPSARLVKQATAKPTSPCGFCLPRIVLPQLCQMT